MNIWYDVLKCEYNGVARYHSMFSNDEFIRLSFYDITKSGNKNKGVASSYYYVWATHAVYDDRYDTHSDMADMIEKHNEL